MKHTYALILMMGIALLNVPAQSPNISLTYTASLGGVHQPLDSIYVENLSRGGSVMLFGTDTVLVLGVGVGIEGWEDHAANKKLSFEQVYPNPMTQAAFLRFYLPSDERVRVSLYDLGGRELSAYSAALPKGRHLLRMQPGNSKYYIVAIETPAGRQVQKVMNLTAAAGSGSIEYVGHLGQSTVKQVKSHLFWLPGDQLLSVGYTSQGSHVVLTDTLVSVPTQSAGMSFQFSIPPALFAVYDIDGNGYDTVHIGNQVWLRQNLRTTRYSDGTPIPEVALAAHWTALSTGARVWYNNDSVAYAQVFGALYNWYAAANPNLCPTGWHVPSDAEWDTLINFLGGPNTAGGLMKDMTSVHWTTPNIGATNASGFSALPAGYRNANPGGFSVYGNFTRWWSTTPNLAASAWDRWIYYYFESIGRGNSDKRVGNSVRCIRD